MTILTYHAQLNRLQRKGRADDGSAPPPVSNRFAGDPGVGKVMTGVTAASAVPNNDGVAYVEGQTGVTQLLVRRYYTSNIATQNTFWNRSDITNDHNSGHISYVSFKLGSDGWAQSNSAAILSGSYDDIFTAEATWAKNQGFAFLGCFYHEPEDNWTTTAQTANYRAIFRRIITIFNNAGATNVNWSSCWMSAFTFSSGAESSRGLEWFQWDPDWKGTRSGGNGRPNASDFYTGSQQLCSTHSFDVYTPNIGGDTYHEYSVPIVQTFNRMTADGKTWLPYVHGEWGTGLGTATGGQLIGMPADGWTGYFVRAFQYMSANKGVGYICYQAGGNSFYSGGDHVNRLNGYNNALHSEAAYLQTVIPS